MISTRGTTVLALATSASTLCSSEAVTDDFGFERSFSFSSRKGLSSTSASTHRQKPWHVLVELGARGVPGAVAVFWRGRHIVAPLAPLAQGEARQQCTGVVVSGRPPDLKRALRTGRAVAATIRDATVAHTEVLHWFKRWHHLRSRRRIRVGGHACTSLLAMACQAADS